MLQQQCCKRRVARNIVAFFKTIMARRLSVKNRHWKGNRGRPGLKLWNTIPLREATSPTPVRCISRDYMGRLHTVKRESLCPDPKQPSWLLAPSPYLRDVIAVCQSSTNERAKSNQVRLHGASDRRVGGSERECRGGRLSGNVQLWEPINAGYSASIVQFTLTESTPVLRVTLPLFYIAHARRHTHTHEHTFER